MSENEKYFNNLLDSRKNLIKEIIRNIENNSEYEKESYKIGLYGTYGSGKSYFLNSFKEFLENKDLRKNEDFNLDKEFKIIEMNAWKEDFLHEPILSIGLTILEEIKKDFKNKNLKKITNKKINKLTKNIWNVTKSIGKNIVPCICKTLINRISYIEQEDIKNVIENIKKDSNNNFLNKLNTNIINNLNKDYYNYKDCINNIKTGLEVYIKALNNKRLLIIIDELDRCRPDYAIEFLEAINHIFNVKNIVFLFAVDDKSLSSAFTTIYGNQLNFDNYIKKFIDTTFILNAKIEKIDKNKYIDNKFISYGIDIDTITKQKSILVGESYYPCNFDKENIYYLFNDYFKLELRDIDFIFRILNSYLIKNKNKNNINIFYLCSLIFLSSLKTKDNFKYQALFNNIDAKYNHCIDINLSLLNDILKDFYKNNFTNVIGCSIFKNMTYNKTLNENTIYLNQKVSEFFENIQYEDFRNIFSKEYFEDSIIIRDRIHYIRKINNKYTKKDYGTEKLYEFPSIYNELTSTKDPNKSILRQCYELIY